MWLAPPLGFLKLITDASMVNCKATGGGVMCDHYGNVTLAFYKELGEMEVLEAEAYALLNGLQACFHKGTVACFG